MSALIQWISPAALWGLAAALPAVFAEYMYRTVKGPWWEWLWLWIPLQLAIGYCIYRLVTIPNTTLLDAFVIWAFSTTFMRVIISVTILHDDIKPGTWFALGLLLMARIAQTFWGR
ncbi:MAG: hypothetical protein Q8R92_16815 [Deltaproteobacteria bacterium]|nr:hypothetical protein [Deltaproteobacteria bacterium]